MGWSCSPAGCRSRTSRAGRTARRRSSMWTSCRTRPARRCCATTACGARTRSCKAAARDFGGHPLALGLLASFLTETQNGDVRRRDHIRAFFADPDNPRHDHARRVMESYEKEWLTGQPVAARDHAHGRPVRPAGERRLPARRCARRRRSTGSPTRSSASTMAHGTARSRACARCGCWRRPTRRRPTRSTPIRWCASGSASGCRQTNEAAWKAAHGRLYEHLRDTTKEGDDADARRPRAALPGHRPRLPRRPPPGGARRNLRRPHLLGGDPDGELEFYAERKLGALGSDLAAISWFFDKPYETPVERYLSGQSGCLRRRNLPCARRGGSPRRCRRHHQVNAALLEQD